MWRGFWRESEIRLGTTQVVNRRFDSYDVYIGRGSKFGNPFEIGPDGTRDEVIEKFRVFFYEKLKKERFLKAVEKLKGRRLGCYCRPKEGFRGRLLCHGQHIFSFLEHKPPEECP